MLTKFHIAFIPLAATLLWTTTAAQAEELGVSSWEDETEIGVLAGLTQVLIGGANFQLEARHGRFVFDYSHGFALDLPVVGDAKDQGLALYVPFTTGMGFGYKLIEALDIRFEPKLHKFEVSYDGGADIVDYKTVTLGLGAYYSYRPFKTRDDGLDGITMAFSVRWWQNVWSELDDDKHTYQSTETGVQEVHEASNIGFFNTPVIVNLSVGYVFDL